MTTVMTPAAPLLYMHEVHSVRQCTTTPYTQRGQFFQADFGHGLAKKGQTERMRGGNESNARGGAMNRTHEGGQ